MHTSIAGGFYKSLERARALGCATVQIFSHNPRSWALTEIPAPEARLFRAQRRKLKLSPLYIHACYLINLISASGETRRKSLRMLEEEMKRADTLGADYLILHAGGIIGGQDAIKVFADSVRMVLRAGRFRAGLLIENTAGASPFSVEALARVVKETGAAGVCLDSCHAFAAGYDIGSPEGVEEMSRQIERHLGRGRVRLLHLNDSKGPLGGGRDRHEHLGAGKIGLGGLGEFLNAPPFRGVPVILETPRKDDSDDARNLAVARRLVLRSSLGPKVSRSKPGL